MLVMLSDKVNVDFVEGQLSGRDAGSSQQAGSSDMRLGLLQSLLQYNASTDLQNFQASLS